MTKISNLYALTNYIYVNSSGTAIGIGTTTPASKLEVAGDVTAHGALTLGSGYAITFKDPGTIGYTGIEGSSYNQSYSFLAFTTGGSEKVRIDSSGNFGIGVAIPSYKLDVNGTARISGAISGTSASFSGSLTSSDALISTDGTNTIRLQKNYFGGIDALYQSGTNAFGIYLGGGVYTAAKLYITNGGNVGIGTTSPGDLLTVVGSGLYPRITIQSTNAGSSAAGINFADNSGAQWAIAYDKAGSGLQFFKEGAGNKFYVTNSGYVGINTSSPSVRLNTFNTDDLTTIQVRAETNTSSVVSYVGIAPSIIEYYRNIDTGVDLTIQTKIGAGGGGGAIVFAPNSPSVNLTPVERMRITKDGYVGIATSGYAIANTFQLGRVFGFVQDINSGYIQVNMTNSGNYYVSQYAARIHLDSALGVINFLNAGSGTAGSAVSLTTRMQLTNTGNLLIGSGTGDSAGLNGSILMGTGNASTGQESKKIVYVNNYSSATATPHFVGNWMSAGTYGFGSDSAANDSVVRVGQVTSNSSGWYFSGVYVSLKGSSFPTTSDYRIKENVSNSLYGLDEVVQLRPVKYNLISQDADGNKIVKENFELGFIAHEVQAIVPEVVQGIKDELDANGNPIIQSLEYSRLVPVLVKAIQELSAKVTALENK